MQLKKLGRRTQKYVDIRVLFESYFFQIFKYFTIKNILFRSKFFVDGVLNANNLSIFYNAFKNFFIPIFWQDFSRYVKRGGSINKVKILRKIKERNKIKNFFKARKISFIDKFLVIPFRFLLGLSLSKFVKLGFFKQEYSDDCLDDDFNMGVFVRKYEKRWIRIFLYFFNFFIKKLNKIKLKKQLKEVTKAKVKVKKLKASKFLILLKSFTNDLGHYMFVNDWLPVSNFKRNRVVDSFTVIPKFSKTSSSFHIYDNFSEKTLLYFSIGLMGFRRRRLKRLGSVTYRFFRSFVFFLRYHRIKSYLKFRRFILRRVRKKVNNLRNAMRRKNFLKNIFNLWRFKSVFYRIIKKFNAYFLKRGKKIKRVRRKLHFIFNLKNKIIAKVKPVYLRKKKVKRKRRIFNSLFSFLLLPRYDFELRSMRIFKMSRKAFRAAKFLFYRKYLRRNFYFKFYKLKSFLLKELKGAVTKTSNYSVFFSKLRVILERGYLFKGRGSFNTYITSKFLPSYGRNNK